VFNFLKTPVTPLLCVKFLPKPKKELQKTLPINFSQKIAGKNCPTSDRPAICQAASATSSKQSDTPTEIDAS
jgi:hypothetical protein